MKKHMLVSSFAAFLLNLVIFIFLAFLKSPFCLAFSSSYSYEDCAPRTCSGTNVSFPFYISGLQPSDCGYPGFELHCNNRSLMIQISGNNYSVEFIFYDTKSMWVVQNFPITTCPSAITNITLVYNSWLQYPSRELYIYMNCSISKLPKNLTRYRIGSCDQLVMSDSDMNFRIAQEVCTKVVGVPIELEDFHTEVDGGNYADKIEYGFFISWSSWSSPDCDTCTQSGGRCALVNQMVNQFICLCPNSSNADPGSEGCQTGKSILPI